MNNLDIQNVHKYFQKGNTNIPVLSGIDLSSSPGQLVAITGSSGSGKSTLLSIIGGLDNPSKGKIIINGKQISGLKENKLSLIRNKHIGFVWQNHQLLSDFSALENVALPMALKIKNWQEAKILAREALEKVGLGHRLEHNHYELSGGEMQRVSIARALINKPSILLADEPTGNLDDQNAKEVIKLLQKLTKEHNSTLILVTHSQSIANDCDDQYELKNGLLEKLLK